MESARSPQFFFDARGKGRDVAEHHGNKQIGNRCIVHALGESLSQPTSDPKSVGRQRIALILSEHLQVVPVFALFMFGGRPDPEPALNKTGIMFSGNRT